MFKTQAGIDAYNKRRREKYRINKEWRDKEQNRLKKYYKYVSVNHGREFQKLRTNERNLRLVEDCKKAISLTEIEEKYKLKRKTIQNILRKYDVALNNKFVYAIRTILELPNLDTSNLPKSRVRAITRFYVSKGLIIKPTKCSRCPSGKFIQAHHLDYSKPFLIIWLCAKCHYHEHGGYYKKKKLAQI